MTKTTLSATQSLSDIDRATVLYRNLKHTLPATKHDLKNYVKIFLGLDIPDKNICSDHNSPMDYLWHSFSCDFTPKPKTNADCVIWANRAGGKTQLAAVATLLDCFFKPKCHVRILGGSGEQSTRMYEYMIAFLRNGFEKSLSAPVRKGKCSFINGSNVELLTQSATSVRGQHVQKLRCDEVELFDQNVFAAAKFTTLSKDRILAAMEIISTMHRPYGLMQKIVSSAKQHGTPIFKWCIWEVIEKCTDRSCSQCCLYSDCQGKARKANGY